MEDKRTSYLHTLALLVLASALPLRAAQAYVPDPRPMPCMLYFLSDAVFIGEVTAVKELNDGDDKDFIEGWDYTLKVIKSYRGADVPTIQVHTENDSGRLPLEIGKKYLLFVTGEGGKLSIGYDSLSGELKHSSQVLKELDRLVERKAGQGGDVFGRVTLESFGSNTGGVGGIHVSITGSAGGAQGVTNRNGWFRVHLPAGTYSAQASGSGWTFKPLDITWQNSDFFTVPDGGCAEIQIEAHAAHD